MMESEAEKKYAEFEEKVKHSIYLDNLWPQVNDAVIRTAFDQYANVKSIQFIPNYTEPDYNGSCALVEFDNEKQAEAMLDMLSGWPFMMSGMPRPVRGRPAQAEMFSDRPAKPGTKIELRWVDSNDPDFEVIQELKRLAKKHAAEQSLVLKKIQQEEKLSKQQSETLKSLYQKYDMMDSLYIDGSSRRLANVYGVNIVEELRTTDFD